MIDENTAYCGVDCSACADLASGKCPGCRRTVWPEGEACPPVSCCAARNIACCGQCAEFPCEMMADFYRESQSHREAYERMLNVKNLAQSPEGSTKNQ